MQDLLPDARGRAIFDSWLEKNASPDVRKAVKENITAASNAGVEDHAGVEGGRGAAAKSTSSVAAAGKVEVGINRNPFDDDNDVDGCSSHDFRKKTSRNHSSGAAAGKVEVRINRNPFHDDNDVDGGCSRVIGKKASRNHWIIVDFARSRFLPKSKGNDGTKSSMSAIASSPLPRHDEFSDNDTLESSLDVSSLESRVRAAALSAADEIRNETLRTGGTQADAEAAAVRAALLVLLFGAP